MSEPLIHSCREDALSAEHALAFDDVYCAQCSAMLHAHNNECMRTWVEGVWLGDETVNLCLPCFARAEG